MQCSFTRPVATHIHWPLATTLLNRMLLQQVVLPGHCRDPGSVHIPCRYAQEQTGCFMSERWCHRFKAADQRTSKHETYLRRLYSCLLASLEDRYIGKALCHSVILSPKKAADHSNRFVRGQGQAESNEVAPGQT